MFDAARPGPLEQLRLGPLDIHHHEFRLIDRQQMRHRQRGHLDHVIMVLALCHDRPAPEQLARAERHRFPGVIIPHHRAMQQGHIAKPVALQIGAHRVQHPRIGLYADHVFGPHHRGTDRADKAQPGAKLQHSPALAQPLQRRVAFLALIVPGADLVLDRRAHQPVGQPDPDPFECVNRHAARSPALP